MIAPSPVPRAPVLVARGVTWAGEPEGIDLSIRPGEVHALVGAPGSGKTTLLRILAGLAAADSGEVALLGQEVTRAHELRSRVTLVRPTGLRDCARRHADARPLVMLVDDPSRALDAGTARELRVLVSWIASSGTSIVWATRYAAEVSGFADRVTRLRRASSGPLLPLP
jgi:ABC-type multidrug transport system ATPase subunit